MRKKRLRRGSREWWKQIRKSPKYLDARRAYIARNPLCEFCRKLDINTPAVDVDHIIAVYLGGSLWDTGNWQSLCRECHATKTAFEKREYFPGSPEAKAVKRKMRERYDPNP